MSTNDDLIRRLCEASEGSAELSAEVWEALTGEEYRIVNDTHYRYADGEPMGWVRCLTTDLSAAWEEAERRGHHIIDLALITYGAPHYTAILDSLKTRVRMDTIGSQTGPLALSAAILAAEGER